VPQLEVNQEAEVVVESKKLSLLLLVSSQLGFESLGVAAHLEVSRAAVVAVAVLRHVRFDSHSVLFRDNWFLVVNFVAFTAFDLAFFDVDEDFIGKRNVDEGVHATLVLFQKLSLTLRSGVVLQKETFLGVGHQSEELNGNLLVDKSLRVISSDHLLHSFEEGMVVIGVNTSVLLNVGENLAEGDDGHSQVN